MLSLHMYQLTRYLAIFFFFFQAEDGIRDKLVTGVQTCALPIFFSSTMRTASIMLETVSDRASRISSSEITRVLGIPSTRSRPLISIVSSSSRGKADPMRSEEHTSELQSLAYLVCRLLLEKKKPHSRIAIHRDCQPIALTARSIRSPDNE